MDKKLNHIMMNPNDFRLCKYCGKINWFENDGCRDCGKAEFRKLGEGIVAWCKAEYDFWEKIEGLTEEEADAILLEV